MRVIPPKHYHGDLGGWEKKQFIRFEDGFNGLYGVRYSGEKVRIGEKEEKKIIKTEKAGPTKSPWPDSDGWLRIFGEDR